MKLTLAEVNKMVGGKLEGDPDVLIEGAAGLAEASEKDLSFLGNPRYAALMKTTKAAAVLVPSGFSMRNIHQPLIRTKHPQGAFAKVLTLLAQERRDLRTGIHPTAVMGKNVSVGQNVYVGAYSVIEDGAFLGDAVQIYPHTYVGRQSKIGKESLLYPQVVVREEVTIGERCIIHSGTIIGSDGYGFATQDGKHHKIPQLGAVLIGDDVEIGANVTIDRATTGATSIGRGTKIDNLVQIAHNVKVGEDCLIVAQVGISGSTTLGHHVTVAGQAGVAGHLHLGDGVVVAGQSGVMKDLPAGSVVFGTPSRPHREAMKLQVLLGKLPELYQALTEQRKKKRS